MPVLAFDMDGTITPPKQHIDPEMYKLLSRLCEQYTVWVVTGASRAACDEQLGYLVQQLDRIYCCSATEVWSRNRLLYSNKLWLPDGFADFLDLLASRGVTHSTRSGVLTLQFTDTDDIDVARAHISARIRKQFPSLQAHPAGRTSVDVIQRDAGKHTAIEDTTAPIWYWGDECDSGGNDSSIAERLEIGAGNRVFRVTSWQDTLHQLKEMFDV